MKSASWKLNTIVVFLSLGLLACNDDSGFKESGGNKREKNELETKTEIPPNKPEPQVQPPVPAKKPKPTNTAVKKEPTFPESLPERAVVKGSFAVFTVPEEPKTRQDYDIHIVVTLPSDDMITSKFGRQDLSGNIRGTDSFSYEIGKAPFLERFVYEPGSDSAELIVNIPGGQRFVRDTIQISSSILNENQEISIVFGENSKLGDKGDIFNDPTLEDDF